MEEPAVTRERHPVRRALLGLLVCGLVLVLAAVGGLLYLRHSLTDQMGRIDGAFEGLEDRPPVSQRQGEEPAVNILVMGTDLREEAAGDPADGAGTAPTAWIPGAARTDTIMLVHIDGDRRGASVISIPRDSWVDIPGHGTDKINAAFSLEGPSLAVETVERLTGVRIDHLAVVDWSSFQQLIDTSGGVEVTVPETVFDPARDITWTAGRHRLSGEQALLYVRQRLNLPGGDLDRVRRQQAVLRTLLQNTLHAEMRRSPRMVYRFLDQATEGLSVDEEWSVDEMTGLAISMRHLRTSAIDYLTAPVSGFGTEGAASVVYLDRLRSGALWQAVREDAVGTWVSQNKEAELTRTVG